MATYTHAKTPGKYAHGSTNRTHSIKGERDTSFTRYLDRSARTRFRPTSLLKVAKRIYSEAFPAFGASKGVSFESGDAGNADFDLIKKEIYVVGKIDRTFRSFVA